jgi:hypothetical protein
MLRGEEMNGTFLWRSYWLYLSNHGPETSSDEKYVTALGIVAEASRSNEIPLFGTSPADMRLKFIAMLERNSSEPERRNCLFEVCQLFMMICRDNMISPDNTRKVLSMAQQDTTRRNVMDAVFVAIKPVYVDGDNSDGNDRPHNNWNICKHSPIRRGWCSNFEDILWESAFSPIRLHSTYNSQADRNTVRASVLKRSATLVGEILIRDLNNKIATTREEVDERVQKQEIYYDVKGKEFLPFIELFFFQFRLNKNAHDHHIREVLLNLQEREEDERMIRYQTQYMGCRKLLDCIILVCMLSDVTSDLNTDAPNIVTFMRDELGGLDSDVHTSKMFLTSHLLKRIIELVKVRLLIGSEWPNMNIGQLCRTTASVVTAVVSAFIHWIDGPMSFDMAMFVVQFEIDDNQLNHALAEVKKDHKKHTSKRSNTGKFPAGIGISGYTVEKNKKTSRAESSFQWRRAGP